MTTYHRGENAHTHAGGDSLTRELCKRQDGQGVGRRLGCKYDK